MKTINAIIVAAATCLASCTKYTENTNIDHTEIVIAEKNGRLASYGGWIRNLDSGYIVRKYFNYDSDKTTCEEYQEEKIAIENGRVATIPIKHYYKKGCNSATAWTGIVMDSALQESLEVDYRMQLTRFNPNPRNSNMYTLH
jgi:hypothetical protein